MTPTRTRKPAARTLTVIGGCRYRLTVGKESGIYRIDAIPSDFGAAFVVEKIADGSIYHVLVRRDGTASCDCIAGSKGTHCKHAGAVLKLIDLGLLSAVGMRDDGAEREWDHTENDQGEMQ